MLGDGSQITNCAGGQPAAADADSEGRTEGAGSVANSKIDHSDIPPLTDASWKAAVKNPFYKPTKQATTVRVDSDVPWWLNGPGHQGKGYQTSINASGV